MHKYTFAIHVYCMYLTTNKTMHSCLKDIASEISTGVCVGGGGAYAQKMLILLLTSPFKSLNRGYYTLHQIKFILTNV